MQLIFFWFLLVTAVRSDQWDTGRKLLRIDGDIILGGIFPMHESVSGRSDMPCGAVKEEKGMQRLEAMLYAIDEINNNQDILPNITLGALVIDSCSSDTYALEQSMEFVRSYMNKVNLLFQRQFLFNKNHKHICALSNDCILAFEARTKGSNIFI